MIKIKGKEAPNPKSSADELKAFMEEMLPDYDKDRVYVSDLKKLMKWYNILNEQGLITKEEEEEASEPDDQEAKKEKKAAKPKAKAKEENKEAKPKKAAKSKSAKKGE